MTWEHLPLDAPLAAYDAQAATLLLAFRAGDPEAINRVRHGLPRFLREDVPWLPKPLSDADILAAPLAHDDARMAVARAYDFADWDALVALVEAVQDRHAPVARFEAAVDAVVDGDRRRRARRAAATRPSLVHARSTRRTHFDPPVHGATLLHYVAANGVEGYRQRTPANAVEVADALCEAGADPDATRARLYGGACTTMSLLVSSRIRRGQACRSRWSICWSTSAPSVEPQATGVDIAAAHGAHVRLPRRGARARAARRERLDDGRGRRARGPATVVAGSRTRRPTTGTAPSALARGASGTSTMVARAARRGEDPEPVQPARGARARDAAAPGRRGGAP